jgi:tRNA threonylcarbamoyl adenosine modification protein YeaZ
MKILALEFSSHQRSVAIADGAAPRIAILGRAQEAGGRDTRAFAMIESALQQAQLSRSEIECVAVGLGPGSYTGIRIAISIAQGWQLGRRVKLIGISSVDCLARQAKESGSMKNVTVVVDAQRGEFYLARYSITNETVRLEKPSTIVPAQTVRDQLAAGHSVVGPDLGESFSGATELFPDAAMLARLAGERTDFLPGECLEPIYLRETTFVKAPAPRRIL